jgi:hypothetical protein
VPLTTADYVNLYEPLEVPDDGSVPDSAEFKVTGDSSDAEVSYFRAYEGAAGWQDQYGGRLRKVRS